MSMPMPIFNVQPWPKLQTSSTDSWNDMATKTCADAVAKAPDGYEQPSGLRGIRGLQPPPDYFR
jgi:hypothetical protein